MPTYVMRFIELTGLSLVNTETMGDGSVFYTFENVNEERVKEIEAIPEIKAMREIPSGSCVLEQHLGLRYPTNGVLIYTVITRPPTYPCYHRPWKGTCPACKLRAEQK